ncbi:MAG: DEAD/DEAH box helicase family protein [Gammaproteobacteria bacterium]|nr:DEAD/DEAH box helicase family protein [Gammaproteobacteria bacterium]
MSFELKEYQRHVLRQLGEFLRLARIIGAAEAYREISAENQSDEDGYENRYAGQYHPIVENLDCPHVCVRVPTAGGKTYLAAHAVGLGATYMETEKPTVLWFAPTDAIRTQTAAMLENRNHPCRIAIENRFGFDVAVYDIEQFDIIRPQDFSDRVCIIVSTTQMFSTRQTFLRRIYATQESFEPHFRRFLPEPEAAPEGLEREEDGAPKLSFANLLHLTRPLVILDEAHRFVSGLSHTVLQRINPACVLEWTATPREKPDDRQPLHNVLVNIPAQALFDEQMVKLPIAVSEHPDWESAVSGAVAERKSLAKIAAGESIRPIVLYQAQDKDEEITVAKLKAHLMEAHGIEESAIAVHTGEVKELDTAGDLLSAGCKIEHVITVKALVEGWDCPFAYVLCTVSNVASETSIEQLLGRIMRMPNARHRADQKLNRAYAHVPETTPFAAAECLRDKLANRLGFEEKEARWAVQESVLVDGGSEELFQVRDVADGIAVETAEKPDFSQLPAEDRAAVEKAVDIQPAGDGWNVRIKEPIPPAAQKAVVAAVPEENRASEKIRLEAGVQRLLIARSPAYRGEKFATMPSLFFYSSEQEKEVIVSTDTLYEMAQWNDLADDCLIDDFSIKERGRTIEIVLANGRVVYGESAQYEMPLVEAENAAGERHLAFWLEKKVRDPGGRYLPATLKKLVKINLEALRKKHSAEVLVRAKYQLAEALKHRLARHEHEVSERTFQECLFDNESIQCRPFFEFPPRDYQTGGSVYAGSFKFKKHYYPFIGGLKSDGEEFECARIIDSAQHVKYWIRNLPKMADSYSIPVGVRANFYPDFVVLLDNGKLLIVEYKGGHLADGAKSDRKKQMGEFIERHSDNCFFLMVTKRAGAPGIDAQIRDKINEILRA